MSNIVAEIDLDSDKQSGIN